MRTVGEAARDPRADRDSRGRLVHPDEDRVYACPTCDTACPRLRVNANRSKAPESPVYCGSCGTGCDVGAVRIRESVERSGGANPEHPGSLSDLGRSALDHNGGIADD